MRQRFLCQRIEYNIHSFTVGRRGEPLLEIQRSRVRYVVIVESHATQSFPFARAGSCKDLEAPVPSQLHRGHTNPAGGGVH